MNTKVRKPTRPGLMENQSRPDTYVVEGWRRHGKGWRCCDDKDAAKFFVFRNGLKMIHEFDTKAGALAWVEQRTKGG